MAYVADRASAAQAFDSTSFTLPLPTHQAGDVLLAFLSKDDAAGGAFTGMSGWTEIAQANVGTSGTNTVRGAAYWKIATSANEAAPTVDSTDADTWCGAVVAVRGAFNTDNPIGTYWTNTDTSGAPYTATASNLDEAAPADLCFVMGAVDGGVSLTAYPGRYQNLVNLDSAANGLGVAVCAFTDYSGPPDLDWYGSGTADECAFISFTVYSDGTAKYPTLLYPLIDIVHPLNGTGAVFAGAGSVTNVNSYILLKSERACGAVFQWDESADSYVDYTSAANNDTTADVLPFPATEAVGDCFYLGDASPFGAIWIDRTGCTAGVGGALQWQYWNGSAWAALPKVYNQTSNFTAAVSTYHVVGFEVPADWASTTVNGYSGYFVRARLTTVYTTNPTLTRLYLGEHGVYYDALGSSADTGVNPFHASLNSTPGSTGRAFGGAVWNFGSDRDVSAAGGILMGTYLFATPRDYIDLGPRAQGGIPVGVIDASWNLKLWTVGAFGDRDTRPDARNVYAIQLDQAIPTHWHQSPTAPALAQYRYFPVFPCCYEGGTSVLFNQLLLVKDAFEITGGFAERPITWETLQAALNFYPFPFLVGSTLYNGLRFGPNFDVKLDLSLFYLEFPQQATLAHNASHWHVDPDTVGVTIQTQMATDVVRIRNGTIAGRSSWRFVVDGAWCNPAASYDFQGLNLVNANITLADVTTYTGMGFLNYTAFDAQGCDLLRCTFSGVPAASGSALFSASSTVKECTMDLSGVASGNHWCAVASPAIFEDNTFTGGGGHAIRLTTPGSYAFQGNTLAGFGADGSDGAFFLNDSGGAVTINVSGGGSTPSVKNGTGASTTIVAGANVTITGLQPGSEVRAYVGTDPATATEVAGVESSGTSFSFAQAVAGQAGYLVVHALGYLPIRLELVYAASDQTLPVQQQVDRQYQNAA